MGRRVTWVVVAAVAAVGVAAAVETLRGGSEARSTSPGEPAQSAPTTTGEQPAGASTASSFPISGREEVQALLEEVGASGVLYLADRSCRLRTVVLPAVDWQTAPDRIGPCNFEVGADGRVYRDGVVIHPEGNRSALCRGEAIDIFIQGAVVSRVLDACAPAWRPDGTLTYVRDGELWLRPADAPDRVILSRRDLANSVGRRAELEEVAWIDDQRLWAVVRFRRDDMLVRFLGRLGSVSFSATRIESLRVGPHGAPAAHTGRNRVTFFDTTGRQRINVSGDAVAWAPDAPVAAVAGPRDIAFVAPAKGQIERLALFARDLEWR